MKFGDKISLILESSSLQYVEEAGVNRMVKRNAARAAKKGGAAPGNPNAAWSIKDAPAQNRSLNKKPAPWTIEKVPEELTPGWTIKDVPEGPAPIRPGHPGWRAIKTAQAASPAAAQAIADADQKAAAAPEAPVAPRKGGGWLGPVLAGGLGLAGLSALMGGEDSPIAEDPTLADQAQDVASNLTPEQIAMLGGGALGAGVLGYGASRALRR